MLIFSPETGPWLPATPSTQCFYKKLAIIDLTRKYQYHIGSDYGGRYSSSAVLLDPARCLYGTGV